MELSRAIASYSGGLPLTLEVLDSYLSYVRSKEVWESIIQQLRENAPREVYKSLKISYDNLGDYEKAIFLDAACFFIGWEKKTVISIWEACGFYPKSAIHRLINRNLIKFESNEDGGCYLRMHDQLRDMGREIVSKESFREPGKRSRLCSHDNVLEVLEGNKRFQNLKVLNLSNCGYLSKSPNFSWFPCLERLDLGYCRSLDKLDESLGQLSKLKSVILESCDSLEELPESICDLKSLVELQLSNVAKIKELPDGVGLLKKLELEEIQGLEGVRSFEDLDAIQCCNLTNSPRKIHGQGRLSPDCPQELIYSLNANDGICKKGLSLVLCIVIEF
ncbi:disease resistance protein Roq1-like isoform X2 [Macadamia integrifolia]|uniref:disease resistance protein Roq1-like isoform X2 n=1 Tax=Macadamia integrifolia TaxID=60698 RepID=UPI001C529507|nr:disease resistance protein Roq1-like isoform X2 [Macadamia integrifolia]